jgi:hypothetical protein
MMIKILSVLAGLGLYILIVDLIKIIITIYRKFKK